MLPGRHQRGALNKTKCPLTDKWRGPSSDANQRGNLDAIRLRCRCIGQNEMRDRELWRGAHGHRSSPIVRGEREGSRNLLATELDQFGDSLCEYPRPSPFGVAHAGLVHGYDAPLG